ncbi:MAG: peptidase S1 [Sphingobacteriales bacterium 41-5]|nr:MAG: peptidase S1 [Sphingobacteriales bacterium 41-5]
MHDHENTILIEAVERYILGEMTPDERLNFENLRKADAEVDQMVVEHTLFLQKMNRFNEWQKFHKSLNDIHTNLAESGKINSVRLKGKAKVVYLFNRYKRVAGIAAAIAGITTLMVSAIISSVTPKASPSQIDYLSKELNSIKNKTIVQDREINSLKSRGAALQNNIEIPYTKGGTGFIIDAKGYLVTNNHVIEGANNVAVQNSDGKEFYATVVYSDATTDIAILKITDKDFKALPAVPYAFSRKQADLAETIYTMGFPRDEIVYGQGYLSSRTGYDGDTLSCQIDIPVNRGNSGSPVLNYNGEVIGIVNGRQKDAQGSAFALQSRNIFNALSKLKEKENADSTAKSLKLNTKSSLNGMNHLQQVKKVQDYIYMVKVN